MSTPRRIQRKRTKGWRMQEASRAINGLDAVYVGRPTKWGNPFTDVSLFRTWIHSVGFRHIDQWVKMRLELWRLRGKNLCCWCPLLDKNGKKVYCHADVLLELANRGSPDEDTED